MNERVKQIAKKIDHSLLNPAMTDAELEAGCKLAAQYKVAAVCIKPYAIEMAKEWLKGSDVVICTVIGFPHGNSSIKSKVFEATTAAHEGATEIDMVVNVGKVLSEDWPYVEDEIKQINNACINNNAIML